MKLSDMRPCDNCGGPVGQMFQVLRMSVAIINPVKGNQIAGLSIMLGSLHLAEVMGDPEVVAVAMDDPEHQGLGVELFICQQCYLMKDVSLAQLVEKRVKEVGDGKD